MATNFPNQVDTFPTMLNITADDAALVAQYQAYMEAGNYAQAQQTLSQMTNGQQKIISAGLMNDVLDSLTATEQYFADRYSPAYVVSDTEPQYKQATDFWFHTTGAANV